ncbi:MAG: hypothetical protein ACREKH_20165 [Candidatus Rokuibacteriota bacterium]
MPEEPLDIGDDDYPDIDGVSFPELVQLHEVMEWENAEADAAGLPLPHTAVGVPPPPDPGVRGSSPFVSRAGWGARTPTCHPTNFRLEGLTIHYSGPSPWTGVDRSSPERFLATALHSRCASIWRAFEAFHMDSRGGCCIFYHCGGCPHGTRFEGRPHTMRSGAQGTDDGNFRSFGIQTLMGLGDPLTDASKLALLDEETRLGVPFRWGHRDWKSTSCPGDPAYEWRLAGFPSPTPVVQPPPPTLEEEIEMLIVTRTNGAAFVWNLPGKVLIGLKSRADKDKLAATGVDNWSVSDPQWSALAHGNDVVHA